MTRLSTVAASGARLFLFVIVGLVSLVAGLWTLVLGGADLEFRRGDPVGVARALRLAPLDAGYLAEWSLLTENRGESILSLEKAVKSNPFYAWVWIQLGLAAENRGDAVVAERDLRRAAEADRGFAPRWALCNFFLRASRPGDFWYWTRQALAATPPEPLPVFRLAWRVSPDARMILERAVPRDDSGRRSFLKFLIDEHASDADFAAISSMVSVAPLPELDTYARKLAGAGKTAEAVELWNVMGRRHVPPFPPKRLNGPNLLTNADFMAAPSGWIFDWQFMATEDLVLAKQSDAGLFKIVFSGAEPEHWRILRQWIPVQSGRRYEFHSQTRMDSGALAQGLRWKFLEGTGSNGADAQWQEFAADDAATGVARFQAVTSLIMLALDYDRPRGAVRLEGTATLTNLTLHPVDAP